MAPCSHGRAALVRRPWDTRTPLEDGRLMNLKGLMRTPIVGSFSSDYEEALLANFDEGRRADTAHHGRRAAYGAAYGVFGAMEDSPIRNDERTWDTVLRMFDIVCDWQHEDGTWAWYLPATQKTHSLNYVWSVFSWLRLFQDFGDHIDTPRRERIEHMLRLAMATRVDGTRQYLDTGDHPSSNNIFMNCTLELWLAGRAFGEAEWTALAAEALDKDIATQSPDGYWPDANVHRGPTTRYNTVSLKSAAAYAAISGSQAARQAVIRAADYHLRLSYPDGSAMETVDERNRYAPGALSSLVWCFAPFEETRSHAALFAEGLLEDPAKAALAKISAIEIDAWAATPDVDVAPADLGDGSSALPTIPAAVARSGAWCACVSGATTQIPARHFHHELQNHLSIWHRDVGLLVGGGNSLHDPRFSTFRFHGAYLAGVGEVEADGSRLGLTMKYGDIRAALAVSFADDATVHLDAKAEGNLPPDSEFAFHLWGLHGKTVDLRTEEVRLGEWAFWYGLDPDAAGFPAGPVTVRSDRMIRAMWPCTPVNIYDPPARLPLEHSVLRISADLCQGPVRITLTVNS